MVVLCEKSGTFILPYFSASQIFSVFQINCTAATRFSIVSAEAVCEMCSCYFLCSCGESIPPSSAHLRKFIALNSAKTLNEGPAFYMHSFHRLSLKHFNCELQKHFYAITDIETQIQAFHHPLPFLNHLWWVD